MHRKKTQSPQNMRNNNIPTAFYHLISCTFPSRQQSRHRKYKGENQQNSTKHDWSQTGYTVCCSVNWHVSQNDEKRSKCQKRNIPTPLLNYSPITFLHLAAKNKSKNRRKPKGTQLILIVLGTGGIFVRVCCKVQNGRKGEIIVYFYSVLRSLSSME